MILRTRSIAASIRPRNAEDWFVFLFALSSFVGIWYALPMLNVIADIWPFTGGVLRAMEAHSLLPGFGIDYGIVQFYIDYLASAIFLVLALPFSHFSLIALKLGLLNHPEMIYWVARATSAAAVAACILLCHRFLKQEVASAWYRVAIIAAVFGNIMVASISRTGKVWVLSAVFALIATILAYQSIRDEATQHKLPGKYAFWSLICVALAAANFPFEAVSGIIFPVLLYTFRGVRGAWWRITQYAIAAVVLTLLIVALDYQNTIYLFVLIFSEYHPLFVSVATTSAQVLRPSYWSSIGFHGVEVLVVYPLVLALIALALFRGIRNKTLLYVSAIPLFVFFLLISWVDNWDNWYTGLGTYLFYVYPMGFLFLPLLASLRPPQKSILIGSVILNTVIFIYTITLLSIPSTYNIAAQVIEQKWGTSNSIIDDRVFQLDLPMNTSSYALLNPLACGTKCANALIQNANSSFKPIVVTVHSADATSSLPRIVIFDTPVASCGTPIIAVPDATKTQYFDIEYALGNYFEPNFYTFNRLGKHIYVYNESQCSALPARL